MYESYWQLRHRPFGSGTDTGAYYPVDAHQAALLRLRYVIEQAPGAAILAGESGLGKSLLVRLLAEQLPAKCQPLIHLTFPLLSPEDLMASLAAELDPERELPVATLADAQRRIQRQLQSNAAEGRRAVLAIDDAHLLEGHRTWEALRLLLNIQAGGEPALTLLLVGQPGLLSAVERQPALEAWLGARSVLRPLSLDETAGYVEHRLALAGAERSLFLPAAIESLHQLTQGVPRRINRLCDLALLVGYAEELSAIDAEQIEAVAQELVAVAT